MRPGGPAVSIDRHDCGGANSLLQRGRALPMAGQRAFTSYSARPRAGTARMSRAKMADFQLCADDMGASGEGRGTLSAPG